MNILIVGANGGIGRILTKQLAKEEGMNPIAMIRKEEQKPFFEDIGVETTMGNLEDSVEELAKVFEGTDAVVFTAGSGGKTDYDKTLEIDLDAAVKCMEAAEQQNIDRFLMVSVLNLDNRESWATSRIKPYMIAKYYADQHLKRSKLDYTIIRPGSLSDDNGTGSVTISPNSTSNKKIPREDVASVITACLKNKSTIGKIYDILTGDNSIKDIIK
ncbi:MAG: SDR family oxidoreductase [Balneola sp.]